MIRRDRIGGAAAAVLVQAALLTALYFGLRVATGQTLLPALLVITPIAETVPPPVEPITRRRAPRPSSRAAPAAPRAQATPIVAPPPLLPPPVIPEIIAAAVADTSADVASGDAMAGPGSAAGGVGAGNGSGDDGDGNGGGGTPAEWLRGRIKNSDYPRAAIIAHIAGVLVARYRIGTDGRVETCRVIQSSGSPLLDATTCRLVEQRFRYRPARDAAGHRTIEIRDEEHAWVIAPPPQ